MASAPLYEQRGQAPQPAAVNLGTIAAPSYAEGSQTSAAMQQFGAAAQAVVVKLQDARDDTEKARATTEFLLKNNELEQKATASQDYKNAGNDFVRDQTALISEVTGRVSNPERRETLTATLTSHAIVSRGRVSKAQLANEVDTNVSALDAYEQEELRLAANAASPAEREAARLRWQQRTSETAEAGWISRQKKVDRDQRFDRYLDSADAMATIRRNPDAAVAALGDENNFRSLDPVARESLRNAAADKADQVRIDRVANLARFNPEAASLTVGRVIDPRHTEAIFERGIIPIEGGLNRDGSAAVSPKGAIGLTQIMPDTARAQARKLGLTDVAALDDAALVARLKDDKALNRQLGLAEWRDLVKRYDGNIALAAAGYNAGPAKADEWRRAATAKFGENFTPAQLQSVVTYRETRDYIGKLYDKFDVPAEGVTLSPHGMYRAVNTVGAILTAQESERGQIAAALASTARGNDDVLELIKKGLDVDPTRVATVRAAQEAAASRGNSEAARYMRELDTAVAIQPYIRRAWSIPTAQLDGEVNRMRAEIFAAGANATTGQVNALTAFEKVLGEQKAKRNSEPIVLGGDAGARYYSLQPIDPQAAPEDMKFRTNLASRNGHIEFAQRHFGGSANVLTAEETTAFKDRWQNAGADEQFRLLRSMSETLSGRAYDDTVAAIAGNEGNHAFAGRMARTRPELAREILAGAALMRSKEVGDKAALVRPALQAKLGGQLWPDPSMQDDVVNAALALYTARRGTTGALYDATDTNGIEKAIEEVAGRIVKRNGVNVAAPPGMTPAQFSGALDNVTDDQLGAFGGAYDRNGKPFSAEFIGSRAQLKQLAPGDSRYVVLLPTPDGRGAPVMTAGDTEPARPLVIDVTQLAATRRRPVLTPVQRGRAAFRGELGGRLQDARRESETAP